MKLSEQLAARRAEKRAALDAVLAGPAAETRDMTDDEVVRFDSLTAEIRAMDERISELRQMEQREAAAVAARVEVQPEVQHEARAVVTREQRTYTAETDRRGTLFATDVARAFLGDFDARDRLERHHREERVERPDVQRRDLGTSAFAGLTVPQYLTDLYAGAVSKGRPLADNCRKLALPADGMTVNLSKLTTSTAAAAQTAENAGVQETDADDTLLTIDVRTIAAQQDLSRQALDRSVGAESVILEDLVKRYHEKLDDQLINGTGSNGQHKGLITPTISSVTYTDSSATPSEAYGPLWNIQATIEGNVHRRPTHFVMHSRRFHWFASAIGTNVAMVGFNGATNSQLGSVNGVDYGPGVRGILAGLPVIVDNNIATTTSSDQDTIFCVNQDELFLWEQPGSPLYIRAEQPGAGNLMVKLVVYGYSAFTCERYLLAHGKISGTGLGGTLTYGIAAS